MDIINTEKDTDDLKTISGQYKYVCEYLVAHGARGEILSCMEKMFLKAQENARLREALEFYANGSKGDDLEPKPEKAHLYEKDYPVDHAYWRQRSMSDYWSGRRAREALKGGE